MFKVIVPKAAFKELEKIDTQNQKLIFEKNGFSVSDDDEKIFELRILKK